MADEVSREEARLAAALNRQASFTKPSPRFGATSTTPTTAATASVSSSPRDAEERKKRDEEAKKKRQEQEAARLARRQQEEEERKRHAEQQRLAAQQALQEREQRLRTLNSRAGKLVTFAWDHNFDVDTELSVSGTMTDWVDVPMTRRDGKSHVFSVDIVVPAGAHFYHFKENSRVKTDPTKPAGTDLVTGSVCNKLTVEPDEVTAAAAAPPPAATPVASATASKEDKERLRHQISETFRELLTEPQRAAAEQQQQQRGTANQSSSSSTSTVHTFEQWDAMTFAQLKSECSQRGLATSGSKEQLIHSLLKS